MWADIVSAPAPPVTPKRRVPDKNTFHSTPINRGTAYHSEFANVHTQAAYEHHIKEDLRQEKQVSYSVFILSLFGEYQGMDVKNEDIVSVSREARYQTLVRDFAKQVPDETFRYEPFIKLVDYVLSRMRKLHPSPDIDVVACRNDPTIIRGSDAKRKPDVMLANRDQVKHPHLGILRTKKDVREEYPFQWLHVICFFEHKHNKMALRTQFTSDDKIRFGGSTLGNMPPPPTSASQKSAPHGRVLRSSASGTGIHPTPRSLPSSSSRKRPATSQQPSGSTSRSKKIKTTSGPQNVEEKRKDGKHHAEDAQVQSASYALEMMSNGSIRSHAIGAQVMDGAIKFTYYSHSAIVTCEPIDFMKDHRKFIRMIQGLTSLSKQEWGIEPRFEPPIIPMSWPLKTKAGKRLDSQFVGYRLTLSTGDTLTLGETLYRQHGLIGRATCVVEVESGRNLKLDPVQKTRGEVDSGEDKGQGNDADLGKTTAEEKIDWSKQLQNGGVIVKISWPAKSRTSEREFMHHVRSIVKSNSKKWEWVYEHLPKLIHAEEVEVDVVQQRFKYYVECSFKGFDFELRELRISVQERLLPIIDLDTAEKVLPAWRDIIKCYEWLHDVAKIIHRDISINNFMYRLDGDKVVGVLIDFDLAVYTFGDYITSQHRTGTKPFLAIDLLLRNPKHKYRFDLESCFYVMCWQVYRYHNREEVIEGCVLPGDSIELQPVFQDWITSTNKALANLKLALIHKRLPDPTENFLPVSSHLDNIRKAFRDGMLAREDFEVEYNKAVRNKLELPTFDDDTLGGHVTIKIFRDMLEDPLQYF